jgi:hypothetical protein
LRTGPLDQAELDDVLDQPARYAVGMHADLVRVPPAGTWAHRRADRFALAEDWLPRSAATGDPVEHLVRRYLGAFGPAHRGDVATWAGLKVRDLAPALDRMPLRRFRAEDGAELLDLPRAPLPEPDRPAPVRFLPTWDAVLLTHCRRSAVLPEEHRSAIFSTRNPFSVGTVLVDGQVRAIWRPVDGRIAVSALEQLRQADRAAVAAEAAALEDFHRATDTELATGTHGATGRAASRRRPGSSRQ